MRKIAHWFKCRPSTEEITHNILAAIWANKDRLKNGDIKGVDFLEELKIKMELSYDEIEAQILFLATDGLVQTENKTLNKMELSPTGIKLLSSRALLAQVKERRRNFRFNLILSGCNIVLAAAVFFSKDKDYSDSFKKIDNTLQQINSTIQKSKLPDSIRIYHARSYTLPYLEHKDSAKKAASTAH